MIRSLLGLRRTSPAHWLVNGITLFRVVTFPVLLILLLTQRIDVFKWLLVACYFTDAVDGLLARKLNVTSIFGAKLDSVGDLLTAIAAIGGLFIFRFEFVQEELLLILIPLALLLIQVTSGFIRYGQLTSFHTYLAKISAVCQGFFLSAMFLFDGPVYWLFYVTVLLSSLELIEEILITAKLTQWQANVKGLYWLLKNQRQADESKVSPTDIQQKRPVV